MVISIQIAVLFFAQQFSDATLQPNSLQCLLSSSFDFLLMKFVGVFVSVAVLSYLFQAWWLSLLLRTT